VVRRARCVGRCRRRHSDDIVDRVVTHSKVLMTHGSKREALW
jgi:hypothetical protein